MWPSLSLLFPPSDFRPSLSLWVTKICTFDCPCGRGRIACRAKDQYSINCLSMLYSLSSRLRCFWCKFVYVAIYLILSITKKIRSPTSHVSLDKYLQKISWLVAIDCKNKLWWPTLSVTNISYKRNGFTESSGQIVMYRVSQKMSLSEFFFVTGHFWDTM